MSKLSKLAARLDGNGVNEDVRKLFYLKEGTKTIRFIDEADDTAEVLFHTSKNWEDRVYFVCQKLLNRPCPGCKDPNLKNVEAMAFRVWDFKEGESKIYVVKITTKSTFRKIAFYNENYGTLCDREYNLTRFGSGRETSYEIMDGKPTELNPTVRKKVDKDIPLSEVLAVLDKANPMPKADDEEDEELLAKKFKSSKPSMMSFKKKKDEHSFDDED